MPDLENVKISALTRKSLSSDLAYDDYLPFNDNSAGDQATMAITIGGMNSYFKNNIDNLARSAVSGFPTDTLTAYPILPRLVAVSITSTDGMRAEAVSANMLSGGFGHFSSLTADGVTANSITAVTSISGTTVSADTVSAISLYGTLKSPFNIPASSTSYMDSLHIGGDLHVLGSTITTSAENLSVTDPIIELAKDQTAPGVDFGIIGNRGGTNNGIVFFDESADEWAVAFTDDEASTSGNITVASYSDFQAKDVTFNAATITDGSGIEALNATKLTAGSIPDARVPASNVTQHEAALTIATSQVTDISNYARAAVSGEAMTLSGTNIRATVRIDSGTVSGTNLYGENVYINGTAEANNLDNYVEGTWTPSFTFGAGSTTYTTQDGYYTRVGNLVYCTFKLEINALSTPSGTLTLGGLPIAAGNNTGGAGVGGVVSTSINYETNKTSSPTNTELGIITNKNTQTANLVFSDNGVAPFTATPAMLNDGSVLEASFFYQA